MLKFGKIHLIYYTRLYRLMARTADSHSVNRGSIPRRVTDWEFVA